MIETKRTILKPIKQSDRDAVFAYRSDAETNQYQGWIPKTIDDVETFIAKCADELDRPNTWFQFVIIEKDSKTIIGDLGVHFIGSENRQCELGCTLSRARHGKGFASEVMTAIISYLFSKLDKHRIIGSIDPHNTSSINLVERLGFRKEAHFKQNYFANNQWHDELVYAILKHEWIKYKR
ncbi:MAG: GNAT family N-acetyltransferase [Bacteroidia bacterium]